MNAVCDDTKFDTLSLSGLFTDKSERAEQVQAVYAFLPGLAEKPLRFREGM